jgi:glycine oxidase
LTSGLIKSASQSLRVHAKEFVVTAGAWTAQLLKPLEVDLAIEPVKGQMLLFNPPRRLLQTMVLTKGRYLIPRRDNHLLVGSTLEYSAFDKSTSETALQSLRHSAVELLPELAKHPVIKQWAGLRPGAPNGIPYIGRIDSYSNLSINAGQFRNGLVLAPASARLLTDILLGRDVALDPKPYKPLF